MEEFNISRCAIVITKRCTLKCKLCGDYIPYIENPKDLEFSIFKEIVDKLFKYTDHFGDFSLSGGEPLMHKNFSTLLQYVLEFKEKYDRLLILTNGTLLPNKDTINIIKEHGIDKVQFNISNYGKVSQNVDKLVKLLESNGIKHREIKYFGEDSWCGGWVDYGNHAQKFFTEEEVKENAKQCTFRKGFDSLCVYEDGIFKCGRAHRRMNLGIIPKNTEEYIDILSDISCDDFRRVIKNIQTAPYSTSCKYCHGLNDNQKRYPAAEQID